MKEFFLNQYLEMAPRAGLEPATERLTAVCSTTELPRNNFDRDTYNKTFLVGL